MSAERHTRQRGLVVQDLLADAQIAVLGTGPALPCLLRCLTLMGVASRHGRIRLAGHLRSVTEEDLAHQFLLSDHDLGRPLGVALADRVRELHPETVVVVSAQPVSPRELVLAVPRLEEVHQIRDDTKVDVWGHVLPGGGQSQPS